jgi:hypothetical protein
MSEMKIASRLDSYITNVILRVTFLVYNALGEENRGPENGVCNCRSSRLLQIQKELRRRWISVHENGD